MTRFDTLTREAMNAEQGQVYDEIAERGGRLGGPYGILIRIPRFMRLQQQMGDYLRSNSLSGRERQLATLVTVRGAGAEYTWAVQARASLAVGIGQEVIDAINQGKPPALDNEAEEAIFAVAAELSTERRLSEATHATALERLGLERLADLVVTVGFYSLVATELNAFDVTPPDDAPDRLAG